MTNNKWSDYLKQFQPEFEAASNGGDFDQIPDGKYSAQIEAASLKESKKKEPMVEFTIVISQGKYAGRKEWKYHMLKAERIKFLKWDLNALGLDLDDITQLPFKLPETFGAHITLEIATKKASNGNEYRNLYIKKPQLSVVSSENADPFANNTQPDLSDESFPF